MPAIRIAITPSPLKAGRSRATEPTGLFSGET
jgi:hypothetical protein